jgi:H+/Cl- antiporter ClcA
MHMPTSFYLFVGALFGLLGALTAFLITYLEYSRHQLRGEELWRRAAAAAIVAFVVFVLLALGAGYVLGHFLT